MTTVPQPAAPRQDSGGGGPTINQSLAFRIAVLAGIVLVALAILLVRLWFLQVVGGEQYEQRAEVNRLREVVTEAQRGTITDRNGVVLVGNVPATNVVARPRELVGARRDEVLGRLARRLHIPLKDLQTKVEGGENTPFQSVVLAENVDPRTALYLSERRRQFPGIGLRETFLRDYPQGRVAAHVLGSLGPIPAERADAYEDQGYTGAERVGIGGIEGSYEEWLRGTPGRVEVEVDATGELVGRGVVASEAPVAGNDVELTIDFKAQTALELALRTQVARHGFSTGAAGVALDPRNGEVLAIASVPDFDPATFSDGTPREVQALLADERRPLLNRVVDGQYPAGSTFKPITAAAALDGDFVEADEPVDSPPEIELYDQIFPNFERVSHGPVTMPVALQVSSDTYFYRLGAKFFETGARQPLQDMARTFGFGRKTGIDLPGEAKGLLPTVRWKKRAFKDSPFQLDRVWKPGDSINLSVGQGNLLVTPLQMAVSYAGVATGKVPTPALGRRVVDRSGEALRSFAGVQSARPVAASAAALETIREGLRLAANEHGGTSASVFSSVPGQFTVAGKTGTAEQLGGEDHSWYVGYAPADNPRVVVAVIIERGGTGASAAAPAVCEGIAAALRYDASNCGSGAQSN